MDTLYRILSNLAHVPGIVIACALHEYVKAVVSSSLGDPTPKNKGRLTLNPLNHLEPIGFMFLFFFGLGWGKPVETRSFGYKNRRSGELITYITPSAVNAIVGIALAFAALSAAGGQVAADLGQGQYLFCVVLMRAARINFMYALFNMLPVYPLDCARVISTLKPNAAMWLKTNEKMCQMTIMLLLCLGIFGQIFGYITDAVLSFAYILS